jgi:hypothetical protein
MWSILSNGASVPDGGSEPRRWVLNDKTVPWAIEGPTPKRGERITVQEVVRPDAREQLSVANHVGDGLADALEEARRCEWSHSSPAEQEAIVANADEWIGRAHKLGWGAARDA